MIASVIVTIAGLLLYPTLFSVLRVPAVAAASGIVERVKKTTQSGLLINVCITFIAVVLVQIFSENIIMLFDPASTDVIKEGVLYLRICCSINSLVYAVMYTLDSFAIGIGSANIAMCNALLDAVFVRLPVCGSAQLDKTNPIRYNTVN